MGLATATTTVNSLTEWGNWTWHHYQPQGGTVTTYAADPPTEEPEPATPIEGDTPLPIDDPADDDEDNDGG